MTEIWKKGALEIVAAIRGGEISCREAVQAHLDRIDTVNSTINAVVRRYDDAALKAADEADAALAAGRGHQNAGKLGPLHGLPVTLKENVDMAGEPTTQGMPALLNRIAEADEPAVARLRAAGAIVIGRTNLPDMGLRLHTDSGLYGPTVNPWDSTRTPGGSSGGEAAALSTGMSPLGLGNDYCGSLRWPSQACGVATLKPTLGAIPRGALAVTLASIDLMMVHGPMARHVQDLRVAYGVMAGPDPVDPWTSPVLPEGAVHPHLPKGKVAVSTNPGGERAHSQVVSGIEKAAAALEAAGYEVSEGEPPNFQDAVRLWSEINKAVPLGMSGDMIRALFSEDALKTMGLWGAALDVEAGPETLGASLARRTELLREWGAWFNENGLWLTATATDIPFKIGDDLSTPERMGEILRGHRVIMATNALCLPSTVVPVGHEGGLPQSVQIIGPRFSEYQCLDAAEAVEQVAGMTMPIDPK